MARQEIPLEVRDRVLCIKEYDHNIHIKGNVGTVIVPTESIYGRVGVQFDSPLLGTQDSTSGHSCCGKGKDGHCWNIPSTVEFLKKITEEDYPLKKPSRLFPIKEFEKLLYK